MKKVLSVLAISLLSFTSMAVEFFEPKPEFKTKVDKLVASNAKSIKYFKADHGLTGIGIVTPQYRKMVFYTNDNADYIISGVLIDTESVENLTNKYSADLEVDLTDIRKDLSSLNGITQGEGQDEIYAVVDVNCGYCHKLWAQIQSIYNDNPGANLKVHWIPVGFLGADSLSKAQSIASETDNKSAFNMLKSGMARQPINISPELKLVGQERLKVNDGFMRKHRFGGVPLVVSKIDGRWDINPSQKLYSQLKQKNKSVPISVTTAPSE